MGRTRIKICGITSVEGADAAVEAGADALGFVFVRESPRRIEPEAAFEIISAMPPLVGSVGVFRNTSLDEFIELEQRCPTDWSQLHGSEPEDLVRDCGPRIIRGIRFDAATIAADLRRWSAVEEVEAILVDGSAGGEGVAFNWGSLRDACAGVETPIIIAGGLSPENVGDAVRACRPYAVDVSSGVETSPGVKDAARVRAFCEAVRRADSGD